MARTLQRETFIALRARRQAYQIARDILHPNVRISSIPCGDCGRDLEVTASDIAVVCPGCGKRQFIPSALLHPLDEILEDCNQLRKTSPSEPSAMFWIWLVLVALAIAAMLIGLIVFLGDDFTMNIASS